MTVRGSGVYRTARLMVDGDLYPDVATPEVIIPEPPAQLGAQAADQWRIAAGWLRDLGLLQGVRLEALAAYAEACATWVNAEARLRKGSPLKREERLMLHLQRRQVSAVIDQFERAAGLAAPPEPKQRLTPMMYGDLWWWIRPMIEADLYWFAQGDHVQFTTATHREYERRMVAAKTQAAERADAGRRARGRIRELRKLQQDHESRVGVRGSAARAGIMKPTAELERHHEVVVEDRMVIDDAGVARRAVGPRVVTQTPLDRYLRRGAIDERQHRAGDRLREAWYLGGLEPHTTANLTGAGGGGECAYGMARSEAQLLAREAYRNALKAVGKRVSPVLIAVCCEDRSAAEWVLSLGHRSSQGEGAKRKDSSYTTASTVGIAVLRLALDMLADHFQY